MKEKSKYVQTIKSFLRGDDALAANASVPIELCHLILHFNSISLRRRSQMCPSWYVKCFSITIHIPSNHRKLEHRRVTKTNRCNGRKKSPKSTQLKSYYGCVLCSKIMCEEVLYLPQICLFERALMPLCNIC